MKKQTFRVTFLSDIVLSASSNTEGNIKQLDFIPGSNFLGMVAKHYNEFKNSFEIFHSGAVRFGDATLEIDNEQTYKIPSSFFYEKLDDKKIYNHHKIKDFSEFTQLKQKREGYITKDIKGCFVNYTYTQKSAHDKEKRKSKDGEMYGYKAITSGAKWRFDVIMQENIDAIKIKNYLEKSTQLGKSKSSQYGKIKIEFISEQKTTPTKGINLKNVILYANSRLALIDEQGNATLNLQYLCSKLLKENIDDEKSQIRTSSFTPYNTKRQTKDYERICIDKGSVVVLKQLTNKQLEELQNGVGAYICEGFGEVLINPSFLEKESFSFKNQPIVTKEGTLSCTTHLARFLDKKQNDQKEKLNIAKNVDSFAKENEKLYSNIKPSQWGNIRSICIGSPEDYKDQIKSYISSGIKEWKEEQINTLKKSMQSLIFTKLLAIKMSKIAQKKQDDKENFHD